MSICCWPRNAADWRQAVHRDALARNAGCLAADRDQPGPRGRDFLAACAPGRLLIPAGRAPPGPPSNARALFRALYSGRGVAGLSLLQGLKADWTFGTRFFFVAALFPRPPRTRSPPGLRTI